MSVDKVEFDVLGGTVEYSIGNGHEMLYFDDHLLIDMSGDVGPFIGWADQWNDIRRLSGAAFVRSKDALLKAHAESLLADLLVTGCAQDDDEDDEDDEG